MPQGLPPLPLDELRAAAEALGAALERAPWSLRTDEWAAWAAAQQPRTVELQVRSAGWDLRSESEYMYRLRRGGGGGGASLVSTHGRPAHTFVPLLPLFLQGHIAASMSALKAAVAVAEGVSARLAASAVATAAAATAAATAATATISPPDSFAPQPGPLVGPSPPTSAVAGTSSGACAAPTSTTPAPASALASTAPPPAPAPPPALAPAPTNASLSAANVAADGRVAAEFAQRLEAVARQLAGREGELPVMYCLVGGLAYVLGDVCAGLLPTLSRAAFLSCRPPALPSSCSLASTPRVRVWLPFSWRRGMLALLVREIIGHAAKCVNRGWEAQHV